MPVRPRNETADDLARENAAKLAVEFAFNCQLIKLQEMIYSLDWVLFDGNGKVRAFCEYKYRRNSKGKYKTLLLSSGKWTKAMNLSRELNVPFVMFVEWTDGIFYSVHNVGEQLLVSVGGNSRGQPGDIEPTVHIPVDRFMALPVLASSTGTQAPL